MEYQIIDHDVINFVSEFSFVCGDVNTAHFVRKGHIYECV